jgi:hypothetical protein
LLLGCSRPPEVTDPIEGVPLRQQQTITRNEIGYKWPFDMGAGTIACDAGALFFRAAGTTYTLSRGAGTRAHPNVDAIRRVQGGGPPSDPVSRLTQDMRMQVFARLSACDAAPTGAAAPPGGAECKARIQTQSSLSESELTRIEAEGVERSVRVDRSPS